MADTTIYHNPRCSKSRQALALLGERGIDVEVVRYLDTPPTAAEIESLLELLGLEPRDIMRRNEPEYREQSLDDPSLTRAELVAAISQNPKLLERPILVTPKGARIGRPPETVLEIL